MKADPETLKQENLSKRIISKIDEKSNLKYATITPYNTEPMLFAYDVTKKECYNVLISSNQDIIKIPVDYAEFIDKNGNFITE